MQQPYFHSDLNECKSFTTMHANQCNSIHSQTLIFVCIISSFSFQFWLLGLQEPHLSHPPIPRYFSVKGPKKFWSWPWWDQIAISDLVPGIASLHSDQLESKPLWPCLPLSITPLWYSTLSWGCIPFIAWWHTVDIFICNFMLSCPFSNSSPHKKVLQSWNMF